MKWAKGLKKGNEDRRSKSIVFQINFYFIQSYKEISEKNGQLPPIRELVNDKAGTTNFFLSSFFFVSIRQ